MGVIDEELQRLDRQNRSEVRKVPACLVRSTLFGIGVQRRTLNEWTELPILGDKWSLSYRGETLGQDDFDVFQLLLHFYRETPDIRATRHHLLKQMDRSRCLNSYGWLDGVLARLSNAGMRLSNGNRTIELDRLIEHYGLDEATGELCISPSSRFAELLDIDVSFAAPDILVRRGLKGNLTAWLFNFYDSHSGKQRHSVKLLWQLCGSRGELKKFRIMLRESLGQLVTCGLLKSAQLDEGIVRVECGRVRKEKQLPQDVKQPAKEPLVDSYRMSERKARSMVSL
ncbi:replication initiator protein A [Paraburkholderia bryophila]|uniref:replication initiator protein A n=1 Tax=Paraburkholderia bryophila TaxID=420952 RepID=UPI00234BBAB2|nr:replication initiator protein A [Paraburkholderia bryophila]WCM23145.1 replication initiator protein A [Paraburkholderia bryophila]